MYDIPTYLSELYFLTLDANAVASNPWYGKNRKIKEVDKRVTEKLKENIEMSLISAEMEVNTQSNDDTQNTQNDVDEPKNDDCFRLDLEVLLCPDFNFKEGQDMLLIAAGYPWSNWEEPVVTMKFFKRVAADYIHFKVFKLIQAILTITLTVLDKSFD